MNSLREASNPVILQCQADLVHLPVVLDTSDEIILLVLVIKSVFKAGIQDGFHGRSHRILTSAPNQMSFAILFLDQIVLSNNV